ncbi:hypothetical protein QRX50_31355 [Amycolatopsis carbonis]|uniref:Uncharacterized protein n=1 Tax=Amycolatopsis carbonis TaxID=715471 RepID=A0A9Y2I9U0_9PSEU|nr:hypothetical protein [Amycolatopsis sp. 2-15]WIX75959.1 hypothetical protein QRX50_31355 [Amycolatopsis sp. 2-15]
MHLTVLGCRSGMPADGQASSGYLVETARSLALTHFACGDASWLSNLHATAASAFDGPIRLVRGGDRVSVGE